MSRSFYYLIHNAVTLHSVYIGFGHCSQTDVRFYSFLFYVVVLMVIMVASITESKRINTKGCKCAMWMGYCHHWPNLNFFFVFVLASLRGYQFITTSFLLSLLQNITVIQWHNSMRFLEQFRLHICFFNQIAQIIWKEFILCTKWNVWKLSLSFLIQRIFFPHFIDFCVYNCSFLSVSFSYESISFC